MFSVCNTCIGDEAVQHIAKADIACASASKILREKIGAKAIMQLGVTIPVYVLTNKGKKLVLAYLSKFGEKLVVFKTNTLPYSGKPKGPVLKSLSCMNNPLRTKSLKCSSMLFLSV